MKYWSNVCVEGYCFGKEDDSGNNPCGKNIPSPFCLGDGIVEICPHFAWSDTTERRVAYFPKLRHILIDRIRIWIDTGYWKLRWLFWDCLWFNQREVREFFDNIPVATAENSSIIAEMEQKDLEYQNEFAEWFLKVNKTTSSVY